MNSRTTFKLILLNIKIINYLTLLSIFILGSSCKQQDTKINVILIVTDDQGYGDLSCYGNPILETPNLDKLSKESLCFTDFHVAPMCSPTRGELMTGQCAFRNGATFVCQGKSMPHTGIPTIADIFKANGYATGIFGKWHLGDNYPYRPMDRGFDEVVCHGAWGITSMVDYWENDYFDDTYRHNGKLEEYKGYCTDVWFGEATKWIKKQQAEGNTFFAYIPTNVPHWPRFVGQEYSSRFIGTDAEKIAGFFGMIAQFDEALGHFEKFLNESGLKENTLLIFMTDNGTAAGEAVFNAGMRGKKTMYYEGGHRVPLFIRCPKLGIQALSEPVKTLCHSTDLMPTLVDLCNLDASEDIESDGQSLAGLMLKDGETLPERMVVIQYGRKFDKWNSCVMSGKWRLVFGKELYDIEKDPGQNLDVANQHPDLVEKMRNFYEEWYKELLPLQGQPNYISIGTEYEPETFLCSANWEGEYADNFANIRNTQKFGYWNVQVESTGNYEVSLYHWPKEANLSITGSFKAKGLKALPIKKARLLIGNNEIIKEVEDNETYIPFKVFLKKGDSLRLEPMFIDKKGMPLCGAYFTYVTKK